MCVGSKILSFHCRDEGGGRNRDPWLLKSALESGMLTLGGAGLVTFREALSSAGILGEGRLSERATWEGVRPSGVFWV